MAGHHRAREIQLKIENGTAGRLAGMVIGLKDNICYKGHKVSASSKILHGFVSPYSSTVAERIVAEDAIIIGRLNCDEFAMGSSNENSAFGPVLNDADHSRVPGGSSGGAVVAVQANLCSAAFGSDTGGSVRQPSALCGVYGMKPTYGRISRWGLLAYASSFDIIGPIARSMDDLRDMMSVVAGKDGYDATASSEPVPDYANQEAPASLKIGYILETLQSEGVEPAVKKATEAAISRLKEQGHVLEPISFPLLPYLIPIYYTVTTAEASSNLARYAGMHYGYRSAGATDLETTIVKSRSEGFGAEVKRRIMLGTFVLSAGYYDAYYTKAQKVRRLVKQKTDELFKTYDLILSPTSPTTAFKLGEKANNPISMYLADIFTVHANISGNPAISVPNGTNESGLPIGLQLMADHFNEGMLMAFAARYF
jgi:aspartyl-tRNA(Asn)/glutamyl-tRNA(Gln) amidotransferase subunit A